MGGGRCSSSLRRGGRVAHSLALDRDPATDTNLPPALRARARGKPVPGLSEGGFQRLRCLVNRMGLVGRGRATTRPPLLVKTWPADWRIRVAVSITYKDQGRPNGQALPRSPMQSIHGLLGPTNHGRRRSMWGSRRGRKSSIFDRDGRIATSSSVRSRAENKHRKSSGSSRKSTRLWRAGGP